MTGIRSEARRAVAARRRRVLSAPAPATIPVTVTVTVCLAVTGVLVGVGSAPRTVALVVASLALAAGCAAHRTTASFLAGLILRLIRPYRTGERVLIHDRHSLVEAEIVRIGSVNSVLATSSGLLVVANVRLLRAGPEHSR